MRADGQEYVLELSVLQRTEVYYGNDWESRIVERMCRYKLNGVDGWGFSEFQYRYVHFSEFQYRYVHFSEFQYRYVYM